MIYLDYAASAPLNEKARVILMKSQDKDFANPSSAHLLGRMARDKIEQSRNFFLNYLNADDYYFIFTSSATESNNTILCAQEGVLLSYAEHPSMVEVCRKFSRNIPLLSSGKIDHEALKNLINEKVKVIALSHVNNQSGVINDVDSISGLIKHHFPAIHIHVDAAQSFGKLPLSLQKGTIDSVSVSAHKIGGPKGVGGLYFKKGTNLHPLLLGGGQENGWRSSTNATPLILAFRGALEQDFVEMTNRLQRFNCSLRSSLQQLIPGIVFPFAQEESSPYILTFVLPGISSDIVLRHLEREEIYLSSTSACSSRVKGENEIFTNLGIPFAWHKSVLRASFGELTTEEEIMVFAQKLAGVYKKLQMIARK